MGLRKEPIKLTIREFSLPNGYTFHGSIPLYVRPEAILAFRGEINPFSDDRTNTRVFCGEFGTYVVAESVDDISTMVTKVVS